MNSFYMKLRFGFILAVIAMQQVRAQNSLVISANTTVRVKDNLIVNLGATGLKNNGTISFLAPNGALKFSGNADVVLSGSGNANFQKLYISKTPGNKLTLDQSIEINSGMIFESGNLDLDNSTITLLNSATVTGETENSRAYTAGTGYLEVSSVLNAPSGVNPGNLGAIITSGENMGSVTVRRGHRSQSNSFGNGTSILRFYDVSAANNNNLNAILRFIYLDAELNGLNESALTVWRSEDYQSWTNLGWSSRDASANYVERNGISSFSRWTLSSAGNTLPVTLLKFGGKLTSGVVQLGWDTRDEISLDQFIVERSTNGLTFHPVGNVPAVNTPGAHHYQYTDLNPGSFTKLYYRLRQVDLDNSIKYSNIVLLLQEPAFHMTLYPNPATDRMSVLISAERVAPAVVTVKDIRGITAYSRSILLTKGSISESIETNDLPKGIYFLEVRTGDKLIAEKFVVQ